MPFNSGTTSWRYSSRLRQNCNANCRRTKHSRCNNVSYEPKAEDLLMGAPNFVKKEQLNELNIDQLKMMSSQLSTFTKSFPKFLPFIRPINELGAFSSPVTISSFHIIFLFKPNRHSFSCNRIFLFKSKN